MSSQRIPFALWTLFCLALLGSLEACKGSRGDRGKAGTDAVASGDDGGLVMTIDEVVINDERQAVVDFQLMDGAGDPLEMGDLDAEPRFAFGWIDVDGLTGRTRYQSYIVNDVDGDTYERDGMTEAPALASAPQVQTDSGGIMEDLGDGMFRYTFDRKVPGAYSRSATHTVAAYVQSQWSHGSEQSWSTTSCRMVILLR